MTHIFISHASRDGAAEAQALTSALEASGQTCWIAPRDVRTGVPYPRQIVEAIEACSAMALIVTPGANESQDVLQELQIAHTERKLIAPVVVAGVAPSKDIRYYIGVRHQIAWTTAAAASEALLRSLGVASVSASKPTAADPVGKFDLERLHPAVAEVVLAAREAERQAHAKAAEARQAAGKAEEAERRAETGAPGTVKGSEAEYRWAGEARDKWLNGVGAHRYFAGERAGDAYLGAWSNSKRSGLGVQIIGENSSNRTKSLRYEGEFAGDKRNGFGVYLWRSGSVAAGKWEDGSLSGPCVYQYAEGHRYEGQWRADKYNGLGVLWNADGAVGKAGRWADDKLVEAMKP